MCSVFPRRYNANYWLTTRLLCWPWTKPHVSRRLQSALADESNQLRVDDAAKIVGCWKALSKEGLRGDEVDSDGGHMKRCGGILSGD